MVRIFALVAAVLIAPVALADDPGGARQKNKPTRATLLDRIEKLEKRVAELEGETPVPTRYRPTPPPTPTPYSGSSRHPAATEQAVPESWGRFQFNGQWFYIVPTEQARLVPGARAIVPPPLVPGGARGATPPSPQYPPLDNESAVAQPVLPTTNPPAEGKRPESGGDRSLFGQPTQVPTPTDGQPRGARPGVDKQ